ncbi:MAG: nuclease A inhibitor family protein [Pyrinomonadaceae bacterium]
MATKSSSGATLGEELEKAAEGLRHQSESDYPFQFFTLPSAGESDLTPEGFIMRLGISQQFIDEFNVPVDKLIEERALDDFLQTEDWAVDQSDPEAVSELAQTRRLKEVLKKRLRGVTVFRVGQIDIRCYIAGLDEQNNLAGLMTTAIET